jgi:hypothetical protein
MGMQVQSLVDLTTQPKQKKEIMRALMQWIPAEIGKSKKEVLGSAFLIY